MKEVRDPLAFEEASFLLRHDVDQGKDIGVGKAGQDFGGDPFRSVEMIEPFMNQRDFGQACHSL